MVFGTFYLAIFPKILNFYLKTLRFFFLAVAQEYLTFQSFLLRIAINISQFRRFFSCKFLSVCITRVRIVRLLRFQTKPSCSNLFPAFYQKCLPKMTLISFDLLPFLSHVFGSHILLISVSYLPRDFWSSQIRRLRKPHPIKFDKETSMNEAWLEESRSSRSVVRCRVI